MKSVDERYHDDHPGSLRLSGGGRRAFPDGATHDSRWITPFPPLHDPCRGGLQVGRGRKPVHRLRGGARGDRAGSLPSRHRGGGQRADGAGHPRGRRHRAGNPVGPDREQAGPLFREGPLPLVGDRGGPDGLPPGPGLHRTGQDPQVSPPLPWLERLRRPESRGGGRRRPPGDGRNRGPGGAGDRRGGAGAGTRPGHRRGDPGADRGPGRPSARHPGIPPAVEGGHPPCGSAADFRRGDHRISRFPGGSPGTLRGDARSEHSRQDPGRRPSRGPPSWERRRSWT